jgi:hypothetical protein
MKVQKLFPTFFQSHNNRDVCRRIEERIFKLQAWQTNLEVAMIPKEPKESKKSVLFLLT